MPDVLDPRLNACWNKLGFAQGMLRYFADFSDNTESEKKQAREAYQGLQEVFETLQACLRK